MPNRLAPITFKIPNSVKKCITFLFDQGRFGSYNSRNEYGLALMLCECIFPERHKVASELVRLPRTDRNMIYKMVCTAAKAGENLADSLPEHPTAADILALATRRHHESKKQGRG